MPIKKKIYLILSIISLLNTISLYGLNALWMAILSFILAGLLFNLSLSFPFRFFKKTAMTLCLFCMMFATPITLNQLSKGLFNIGSQALKKSPESLSYHTRFSLWWSAIWMSIGGLTYLVPYTVAEQVLMFWPGPKQRLWNSDFPANAKKVQNYIKNAKKRSNIKDATYKYSLVWRNYCEDNCDVGLALNGGDLTVSIKNTPKICTAVARVSVSYKPQYRGSTILNLGKIHKFGPFQLKIDQSAYWALQELGWLHPFVMRYRWAC